MDEKTAIEVLGSALIETNQPLIITCGTLALAKVNSAPKTMSLILSCR
jgi:hypothetical protein